MNRTLTLLVPLWSVGIVGWAQSYDINTIAGGSNASGADPALKASLAGNDSGLAIDASGNIYIADSGVSLIRKVTPAGGISVVAGDVSNNAGGFYGDGGPAIGAGLNNPAGLAFDSAGNLYIADTGNNRVRKVSTDGKISTVAGGGSSVMLGGLAIDTYLLLGNGLAVDASGDIFLTMVQGGGVSVQILKVDPSGKITAYAGDPTAFFSSGNIGDGGPARSAYIAGSSLAVDTQGNLYIADVGENRIRKISSASGIITTVAGSNTANFSGDGGTAIHAGINAPRGVAVDTFGNLYITDSGDFRIRKVDSGGTITTIGGTGTPGNSGDGGPATSAELNSVYAIAVGTGGTVYITDVRATDGAGLIRALTPQLTAPSIAADGVVPLFSSSTTIQPGEWASIFGSNLASGTLTWNGNFPTQLGGTSVTVDGKPAYLSFVSPGQVNFQAPEDMASGSVSVVVKTAGGSATSTVTLGQFAPSFSLLDGKHVAGIILRTDGSGTYGGGTYDILGPTGTSLGYKTVAAKAGDALELFGVGFGPTDPAVQPGKAFSGAADTTNPVQLLINNKPVTLTFSGITSAGLYQLNINPLPSGLGTGDVSLEATVGEAQTQSKIVISLQ